VVTAEPRGQLAHVDARRWAQPYQRDARPVLPYVEPAARQVLHRGHVVAGDEDLVAAYEGRASLDRLGDDGVAVPGQQACDAGLLDGFVEHACLHRPGRHRTRLTCHSVCLKFRVRTSEATGTGDLRRRGRVHAEPPDDHWAMGPTR
jgi:hypothetical protein